MGKRELGLVCDVGGTNCRFALVERGSTDLQAFASYRCAQFEDFTAAAREYLSGEGERRKISWAVVAVAGPVEGEIVSMTNRPWRVDSVDVAKRFKLKQALLVNDFSALAAATPHLRQSELVPIGATPSAIDDLATSAIVGPGTGLGVGALVKGAQGTLVLPSEGGHAAFAPTDAIEREIARVLAHRFERVSYERLLSGEGLVNIRAALAEIDGVPEEDLAPSQISERAASGEDQRSAAALKVFTSVLGAFSGDVVLMFGARGGLYVAGGMMPQTLDVFDRAAFRERFEDKGRFRRFMQSVPAWIVVHPHAALLGAAALAADARGGAYAQSLATA